MLRRTGPTPRPGFTLIELMVVILIIAILAALTTAAVIRAFGAGKRAQAVTEIGQLDVALAKFKQDFGFYPPSHISYTDATGTHVRRFQMPTRNDQPEFFVLKKMFPRWNPPLAPDPVIGPNIVVSTLPADYQALAGVPLDPNQVLVLFLAGPTQTGWDPNAPYAASPTATNKKGPYFDFQTSRLLPGGAVPRYADPWGTPYAYFSANAGSDTYDPQVMFPWLPPSDPAPAFYTATPVLINSVAPSATDPSYLAHPYGLRTGATTIKWMNPGKFQIISAGPDQRFGAGACRIAAPTPASDGIRDWKPGDPNSEYISSGANNYGYDDIANFNGGAALGESGNQ